MQIVLPPADSEPQQAAFRDLAARFPAFKPRARAADIAGMFAFFVIFVGLLAVLLVFFVVGYNRLVRLRRKPDFIIIQVSE